MHQSNLPYELPKIAIHGTINVQSGKAQASLQAKGNLITIELNNLFHWIPLLRSPKLKILSQIKSLPLLLENLGITGNINYRKTAIVSMGSHVNNEKQDHMLIKPNMAINNSTWWLRSLSNILKNRF